MATSYDALLVISFGGPDGPDDVIPFLENVLRGRNVPRSRLLEVAEHYYAFGGKSPINDQNRALIAALEQQLAARGPQLPIYWGNRNWHPLLADTLRQMGADGVRHALAFFTSAFSPYSGCRQYRENIAAAQAAAGPAAPQVDKLRAFFNHPGFIEPMIEQTRAAVDAISPQRRDDALLLFTAHSIPQAVAAGCRYEAQLEEACRLVAAGIGRDSSENSHGSTTQDGARPRRPGEDTPDPKKNRHLVYQSRSGPPSQPWLEPDIGNFIRVCHVARPLRDVVVVPIGFISDHLEVVYDLDTEVQQLCTSLGINLVRVATVGTHPRFVEMIWELLLERMTDAPRRLALGRFGPSHDYCPDDCCLYNPQRLAER